MTDDEFNAFIDMSKLELERKQAVLIERFGLGAFPRWDYDQTMERLSFSDNAGEVRVEFSAIIIGSFSTKSQTWKWAWANPTVEEATQSKSGQVRGLYERTGFEVFRTETFNADEAMAWELAAMAV